MKIAFYVPSWPPGFTANGIVTYASQLVPALRQLGHEVFILTFHKEGNDCDPYTIDLQKFASSPSILKRVGLRLLPETIRFNAVSSIIASAVRELIEKHGLDVFEMEEWFGWSFTVSRLKLLPVVVRLHGPYFLTGSFGDPDARKAVNRHRIKREGRGIDNAQFVTAPSHAALKAVRAHYKLRLAQSQVIPNPLDATDEATIWDAKTCDVNGLLFVGRFDALKGGDLVLHAFAELAVFYPQLKLTFVGPDNGIKQIDGNVYSFDQYIRSMLPESCWSRIKFCGPMSHHNVMSLRRKHFVTIIGSRFEIFSYTVLEAMSLGCPLVATAVGGIPELIKDQQNGLLVPSQDIKAMITACQMLLNNKALAARLGHQAWQDCRDFYRPDNIARQTIAAYEGAVSSFKTRNFR